MFLAQKRLETRQGRKVIVLLSDGIDVESILSMEQVRWLSRTRQAALYWIRLPRPGETDRSRRFSPGVTPASMPVRWSSCATPSPIPVAA